MAITKKADLIKMLAEIIMDETRKADVVILNGLRAGAPDSGWETVEPTGERCIIITWCDPT